MTYEQADQIIVFLKAIDLHFSILLIAISLWMIVWGIRRR